MTRGALTCLLYVPGDRPDRMEKALGYGADGVIVDLEDSVAPATKPDARRNAAAFLAAYTGANVWVRINPLAGPLALDDLAAIVPGAPDGIILPKSAGGAQVAELDAQLTRLEREAGLEPGRIRVLPIATETPAAIFQLGSYIGAPRLAGLNWGAEDLPAAIGAVSGGAVSGRNPDGTFTDLCRIARSLTIAGAAAAGVPAIEAVYPAFKDLDGLRATCEQARREGFSGMTAIHPTQVPVIQEAFAPSEDELERARRIVDLFAAHPESAALTMDGAMVDTPHLLQARRLLGL